MKMTMAFESMDPRRAFGKTMWSDVAHTIMACDYKAPPICLIVYDTEHDGKDSTDA